MWVWGAGLGQAEISFKPDYGRNSDPRELLLSSPRTFRAAPQEQLHTSWALRVLSQTMLQDTASFHKHRDAVLFPGDNLLSPPHSVLLKKLIHPLNDKAHFPAKIHIQGGSADSTMQQERQQRTLNNTTTTVHRRFPICCLATALRLHRAGPEQVHTICPSWHAKAGTHSIGNPPQLGTYSIGNQSPQSCFTVSMSSWHSRRRFTSVSAVGGTSSVIHACKGRKHKSSDGTQGPIQQHQEGLAMDKAAFPRKVSFQERWNKTQQN